MKTKTYLSFLNLLLLLAVPARGHAQTGAESDPAFLPIDKAIDLRTVRPEVNVNLPRFLLKDALSEMNGGTNDPLAGTGINLADLVKDVKLIRVVVIDAEETNRVALAKGIATLREVLESRWTSVATVPEENIGVYAMGDASGENLAGLAVLINDGGDAVIVNIVGRVSLAKVIQVASRFDKFPKDLLKKLSNAGGEKEGKGEKSGKTESQSEPAPAPAAAAAK
jgi:hypothetical protein